MAEQNQRQSGLTRLNQPGKIGGVGHHSTPARRTEVAVALRCRGGAAVSAMVVGIDVETRAIERCRDMRIPDRMFTEPVRNLYDRVGPRTGAPAIVSDPEPVARTFKREIFPIHALNLSLAARRRLRRHLCFAARNVHRLFG